MKKLFYQKIDAFTSGSSKGNPASCIYLSADELLSEDEMLEIARQQKGFVSEVIYCTPDSSGLWKLTYFSSECEVDFCGHGTIACMYSLVSRDKILLNQKEIRISTNRKGCLTVYNDIPLNDAVYISAPDPVHIGTLLQPEDIAGKLQISTSKIDRMFPLDIIDAGLKTLIVPITDIETEIHIFPDESELKEFCLSYGIDIILIFCMQTADPDNFAHTRVFAPKFGYLEDPATGSGNSAFGSYLHKNNIWKGSPISIEQGGRDRIFNIVKLAEKDASIIFGGRASIRINGEYYL